MAQQGQPADLVTLEELAVSSAYEIAALVAVQTRKGLLNQQELLDEIQRQRTQKAQ